MTTTPWGNTWGIWGHEHCSIAGRRLRGNDHNVCRSQWGLRLRDDPPNRRSGESGRRRIIRTRVLGALDHESWGTRTRGSSWGGLGKRVFGGLEQSAATAPCAGRGFLCCSGRRGRSSTGRSQLPADSATARRCANGYLHQDKAKPPRCRSYARVSGITVMMILVAPTGVDPVTSRFSVVRSTN